MAEDLVQSFTGLKLNKNESKMDNLKTIIHENEYIKNCISNCKKDPSSLSFLIDKKLSQSDCIKLGNGFEKVLSDIIIKNGLTNIKEKNKKGLSERDHLFCNKKDHVIYYAELKANINLDTEKSKSTYTKCLKIVEELKQEYPEYTIKWCLLGYRYLEYSEIPSIIQKKYTLISENLFGINEYLTMLNIDLQFTEKEYILFLNEIANSMFC
jgi:hypothetical protein